MSIAENPPSSSFYSLFASGVKRLCRPLRRPLPRPQATVRALGWAAVLIVLLVLIHSVDAPVSKTLRALPPPLTQFFEAITDIGLAGVTLWPSGLAVLFGLIVLSRQTSPWGFYTRLWAALLLRLSFVFVAVAGSGLIVTAVKRVFGRPRPWSEPLDPAVFEFFTLKSQFVSFPSGHATAIAGGCVALALLFPRARWALAALAVLVCISRIVVGAHFPADIVAGVALGSAFTMGTWRWFASRALIFPAHGGYQPSASTERLVSRLVSGVRKRH